MLSGALQPECIVYYLRNPKGIDVQANTQPSNAQADRKQSGGCRRSSRLPNPTILNLNSFTYETRKTDLEQCQIRTENISANPTCYP